MSGAKFAISTDVRSKSPKYNKHDFGTYSQYSRPSCSQPEAVRDVISDVAVEEVDLDNFVKLGDLGDTGLIVLESFCQLTSRRTTKQLSG